MIEGAPGIGKSRLLEEVRACAPDLGIDVLNARATELEQGFPFGVVRQLFERPLLEADTVERDRWLSGAAALAADVLTGAPPSASRAPPDPSASDRGYALQHGLYWLVSNLSTDSPLALVVDDLQWCDGPSARTLAFIARRIEGQPLAFIAATRPLDPAMTPEAAALVADPAVELLRPSPLTEASVRSMVAARLSDPPADRFVRACFEVTGGNPFLLGELLDEAAALQLEPTAAAATQVSDMVPRGVANAVLLRLTRLPAPAAALARVLSALGDGAQIGDAARLAGMADADVEAAIAALIAAGVMEPGGTLRFAHPILRSAIYGDLSPVERERLHRVAATILRERGAPAGQVAAHVMYTEPAADPDAVALLREAARSAMALGDATSAAALLARALDEPPAEGDREAVLFELGQALARAGAPEAIEPLTEIVERGEDAAAIAGAAIELSGMMFFGGRAAEAAAILHRALARIPARDPAREPLEVTLLGIYYTSSSAHSEAKAAIIDRQKPGPTARGALPAATLVTLAMDEMVNVGSAATAGDLAERALGAGLPVNPHHAWSGLALVVLAVADRLDAARRGADKILAEARERGAALTVATVLAHRALIDVRRGDLISAEADTQAAIALASDLVGSEFVFVLAGPEAVLAGLDRDATPDSLRRILDSTGAREGTEFMARGLTRHASGVLELPLATTKRRSKNCAAASWTIRCSEARTPPGCRGDRRQRCRSPSSAATTRRASWPPTSCAAPGRSARRGRLASPCVPKRWSVPQPSGRRRCQPRLRCWSRRLRGWSVRACWLTSARRFGRPDSGRPLGEPLLDGLALAARCGALALERRARAELAAIGVRPRTTERSGEDSLTPSEGGVAGGGTTGGANRQIAQTLFVTEKTVETHLGRAFRKLDISSRRQLGDVLAGAAD